MSASAVLPRGVWSTSSPLSAEEVARWRPVLERAVDEGRTTVTDGPTTWTWQPIVASDDDGSTHGETVP